MEVPADTPPSPPRGVYTVNYDLQVSICWEPNPEEDVRYYDIYRSEELDGLYDFIGYIEDDYPSEDPWVYCYDDVTVTNGVRYFYSVVAVDAGNNDSTDPFGGDLTEIVSATPRFEGSVTLYDMNVDPDNSGFDIEDYTGSVPVNYLDAETDIYFAVTASGSIPQMLAMTPRVMIQDYGFVDYQAYGFDVINYVPADGWSPSGIVELIEGHVYIIRIGTLDQYNYAKLWVGEVTSETTTFLWAYQTDLNNRELVPGLTGGSGGSETELIIIDDATGESREIEKIKRVRRGRQVPPTSKGDKDVE
ncbi:MAG: hypothetical protein JW814_11795 [Candidatus Krumholzibacteriota bacterium]|nr:hypothetical protein [Candidatus Krumholzibacteriota bacterium]